MLEVSGKCHILIKAGSVVEIGEPIVVGTQVVDYVNHQHVLLEDICVLVENDQFKCSRVGVYQD